MLLPQIVPLTLTKIGFAPLCDTLPSQGFLCVGICWKYTNEKGLSLIADSSTVDVFQAESNTEKKNFVSICNIILMSIVYAIDINPTF